MVAEHGRSKQDEEEEEIQIFIKTLTGKTTTLYAKRTDKVKIIKEKIEEKEKIPPEHQQLVYKGKTLEDDKDIEHYNIHKEDTIHMTARLKGGVTEEEVANVLAMMRDQMAQLQAALNEEKGKSDKMRQTFQNANTK